MGKGGIKPKSGEGTWSRKGTPAGSCQKGTRRKTVLILIKVRG